MIACQHLIKHNCAAILVTAWVNDAAGLLWSHITDRTTHCNGLADPCAGFQGAGNAKIGDHQAVILLMEQDVLGFNIAVNDRARSRMSVVQCASKLMEVVDNLGCWQRSIGALQASTQRSGGIEWHYQEHADTISAVVENGGDVGMI